MDLKAELGKAILDVSEQNPKDFTEKVKAIVADKFKTKLSAVVKAEETRIFSKR